MPRPAQLELLPAPIEILEATGSPAPFVSEIEAKVDAVWQREREKRPQLFDGQIFTVDRVDSARIVGRYMPYRYFLAQLVEPALFEALHIQVLAVTGALFSPDGLIFGRRNHSLTQHGNYWELVPAGGVDRKSRLESGQLDVNRQLLVELEEEVGLCTQDVFGMKAVCAIRDHEHHVVDVVVRMETTHSLAEIQARHTELKDPEHRAIRAVTVDALATFARETGDALLPASALILQSMGYLPRKR